MRLDLGSGIVKREGYYRVDNNPICKPDRLMDMQEYVKELLDNTLDHVVASHSFEFLDGYELYEVMNHLHRAIKPTGELTIEVTSVSLPDGKINPRAWTVPILKTHFSPDTFRCFLGGSTLAYRGVQPWSVISSHHASNGAFKINMRPDK